MTATDIAALRTRIDAERSRPGTAPRARDLAAHLGVTEAELVCAGLGETATRLDGPWEDVIAAFGDLGEVMALTRNEAVVHEKVGRYANICFGAHGGLVLNHDIDLRLFLKHWHFGFAVAEETRSGPRRSLQFFDRDGTAIHKVYLREESDNAALEVLAARFRHADQCSMLAVGPAAAPAATRPAPEIDGDALLAEWAALEDTHDFFPMLRRHKAARLDALRFAEGRFAERLDRGVPTALLEMAAARGTPIMVFVGSAGVIQIHTGPVVRVEPRGPWINVLDPRFNLHLRTDLVAEAWLVRKPTVDGDVTSVEVYDRAGGLMAQVFGERKPGTPEDAAWRALAGGLPRLGALQA